MFGGNCNLNRSKWSCRLVSLFLACLLCCSLALPSMATTVSTVSNEDYPVIQRAAMQLQQALAQGETQNNRVYSVVLTLNESILKNLGKKIAGEVCYFYALNYPLNWKTGYYLRGMQQPGYTQISPTQLQVNLNYFTSSAQEKEIEQWAQKTAPTLVNNSMGIRQKLYAIYHYVTSHYRYEAIDQLSHSMYSGLSRGSMLCTGFAQMIYVLAHYAGIPNVGIQSGAAQTGSDSGHCWATYTENGTRYILDATADTNSNFFGIQYKPYSGFLLSPSQIQSHGWTEFYTPYLLDNQTYRLVN